MERLERIIAEHIDTALKGQQRRISAVGDSVAFTTTPAEHAAIIAAGLAELPAIKTAFLILESGLPKDLRYHASMHTYEVFAQALVLALHDGLNGKDLELIALAAAFHDTGFTQRRQANEEIGAAMAEQSMRTHGYPEEEIAQVKSIIMDTQLQPCPEKKVLRQICRSRLAAYVLDADLANFGQKDFFAKSGLLLWEFSGKTRNQMTFGEVQKFLEGSLALMEAHHWHSTAGEQTLQPQKERNLQRVRETIAGLEHFGEKLAA